MLSLLVLLACAPDPKVDLVWEPELIKVFGGTGATPPEGATYGFAVDFTLTATRGAWIVDIEDVGCDAGQDLVGGPGEEGSPLILPDQPEDYSAAAWWCSDDSPLRHGGETGELVLHAYACESTDSCADGSEAKAAGEPGEPLAIPFVLQFR